MMRVILLFLLATIASAEVKIVCRPLPVEYSRSIFDKRTAKNIQPVLCVASNLGPEVVEVSEARLQAFLLENGVSALSSSAIRLGAGEVRRRGLAQTLSRLLPLGASIFTGLAAMDTITVSNGWAAGAAVSAWLLPELGDRIGSRSPDRALFEQLAFDEISLSGGESKTVYLFAAPGEIKTLVGIVSAPSDFSFSSFTNPRPFTLSPDLLLSQ